jgi:hypothetical protein
MWDEQKSARFQELRRREEQGGLTEPEQAELARLIQELEDEEAAYLGPATERLRKECEAVEAETRALEALVQRKKRELRTLPRDEWERHLLGVASDCGVSLSHASVSSEGLYE